MSEYLDTKAQELAVRLGLPAAVIRPKLSALKPGDHRPLDGTVASTKVYLETDGTLGEFGFKSKSAEAATDESDDFTGAEEMRWAGILLHQFAPLYRMVAIEHNDRRVLHRIDRHTNEVLPADRETMAAEMRNSTGSKLSLKDASAAVVRTMDALSTQPAYLVRESQIAPLLFEDQERERYCYRRLPISHTPLTACPASAKSLFNNCSEAGARSLILWTGSLMDPESDRSQYLVLYGEGNNGKSTWIDALVNVLGQAAVTMSSSDFMNRFGLGDAATARLIAFDDNNNASFMTSGEFKRVTGSQYIRVERKGKDAYRARNNLKIIIACNRLPKLSGDNADMRRNALVQIKPYEGENAGWAAQLRAEMPDIMRYCYTEWMLYRSTTGARRVPEADDSREDVYNASTAADADDFIETYLWEENGAELAPQELQDKALAVAHMDPKVYEFLKHVVQKKWRLTRCVKDGVRARRSYKGVRLRNPDDI